MRMRGKRFFYSPVSSFIWTRICLFRTRQFIPYTDPEQVPVYPEIPVGNDVTDTGKTTPVHFRMPEYHGIGKIL
jgi:hypothetical protein